jgi:hypothetical protein
VRGICNFRLQDRIESDDFSDLYPLLAFPKSSAAASLIFSLGAINLCSIQAAKAKCRSGCLNYFSARSILAVDLASSMDGVILVAIIQPHVTQDSA